MGAIAAPEEVPFFEVKRVEAFEVQRKPIYRAERPVRDAEYRRFVKRLPCAVCCRTWAVDPAHTGPHGIGQKSSDLSCIPLCRRCHDDYDASPKDFAERHHLDVAALIARLNLFYSEKLKGVA